MSDGEADIGDDETGTGQITMPDPSEIGRASRHNPRGTTLESEAGLSPNAMPPAGEILSDSEATESAAADLGPLAKKLHAVGGLVEFRLQRLEPDDLPGSEMGWSKWIQLITNKPTDDDVIDAIRARHGGGVFEIQVRSQDKQRNQHFAERIKLQGPWSPTTYEGAQLWAQRYGGTNMAGASTVAGVPVSPAGAPEAPALAYGLAGDALKMAAAERQNLETLRQQARTQDNDLLAKLLLAQQQPKAGIDVVGLIGALSPLLLAVLEGRKDAAADTARRHEELMATLKNRDANQTPQQFVAAQQALMEIVKEGAKLDLGIKADVQKTLFQQMLKSGMGAVAPTSPIWALLGDLARDVLPDIAKGGMQLLAMKIAQSQAPRPQPQALPAPAAPQQPAEAVVTTPIAQAPPAPLEPGKSIWDRNGVAQPPPPAAPTDAAPAPNPSDEFNQRAHEAGCVAALLNAVGFAAADGTNPRSLWETPIEVAPETKVSAAQLLDGAPDDFFDRWHDAREGKTTLSWAHMCAGIPDLNVLKLAQDFDVAMTKAPHIRPFVLEAMRVGPTAPPDENAPE